ncbi:hypothetical protein [Metamycoplasma hominis]|uniref:hypothetical protein n=1 Tax=Metamycoplasma hominis TaxID=2098 RepID=UPI001F1E1BDB|nr:hypothetical protein [Metamycoplasma hominis]
MQQFIASLDDKYKIKVNTQEYLITGMDSTADYLYPVINEENLQVDTKLNLLSMLIQEALTELDRHILHLP